MTTPDGLRVQRLRAIDRNVRAMQSLLIRLGALDPTRFGPLSTLNLEQLQQLEDVLKLAIERAGKSKARAP